MKSTLFLLLLFTFCWQILPGQDITLRDRIKAEHIFNFGVYINWKDKKDINSAEKFQIGVYGQDTVMYVLLKRICRYRMLKWKKIEILHFTQLKEIKNVPILYVDYDSNKDVPKIDSIISNWNTLLVTDSCNDFRGVMINFFPRNALKKVEINKSNIANRGMKVRSMLYVVSKNYEEDWEKLYQKSETDLAAEKETVDLQQQILKTQEKEILQKKEHINKLFEDISKKEEELRSQQEKLKILEIEILNKNKLVSITSATLQRQILEMAKQKKDIESTRELLKNQIIEYNSQKKKLDLQKTEITEQQELIDSQESKLNKSIADLKKQQLVLYFVLVVLFLIGIMSFILFRNYKIKKKANIALQIKNDEINKQNTEIIQQKEEIETQRDEIEAQRDFLVRQSDQIMTQNKDITDSITYASRIQEALLPQEIFTAQLFFDHFLMYRPRDIVSGDFYWARKKGEFIYIAVADCTGHGVPGAFMSMLGIAFLNEIIDKYSCISSNVILDKLRDKIMYSLHQTGRDGASKDGMDISVIIFNENNNIANISCANNPVYIVKKHPVDNSDIKHHNKMEISDSLIEIKPDKMPIGFFHGDELPFNSHEFKVEKGDIYYMFSDGYADQFGGEKGKKFKYNALKKLCISSSAYSLQEQKDIFNETFDKWKSEYKQVDDVLLLGIRFV